MTNKLTPFFAILILLSCSEVKDKNNIVESTSQPQIQGTWKLLSAQTIIDGDTTTADYTQGIEAIKMINATHFSFFQHDLNQGKDSATLFVSGGGKYELHDDQYKEFLEYCSAREWENNEFEFTVKVNNDTLIQTGVENIPDLNVDRYIIETYVRAQ